MYMFMYVVTKGWCGDKFVQHWLSQASDDEECFFNFLVHYCKQKNYSSKHKVFSMIQVHGSHKTKDTVGSS